MSDWPLTPETLINAYCNGIFPMDVKGVIRWFSPDPRAILPLANFHVPRSLAQRYRSGRYTIRINTAFGQVLAACADRPEGTWISPEIITGYTGLHHMGLAHSVEAWHDGQLVGGLYGVALGGAFFGESMFHRATDASKVALVGLVERLRSRGFILLDIQFMTDHLRQFGAREIPRAAYLRRLHDALRLRVHFASDASDPSAPPRTHGTN